MRRNNKFICTILALAALGVCYLPFWTVSSGTASVEINLFDALATTGAMSAGLNVDGLVGQVFNSFNFPLYVLLAVAAGLLLSALLAFVVSFFDRGRNACAFFGILGFLCGAAYIVATLFNLNGAVPVMAVKPTLSYGLIAATGLLLAVGLLAMLLPRPDDDIEDDEEAFEEAYSASAPPVAAPPKTIEALGTWQEVPPLPQREAAAPAKQPAAKQPAAPAKTVAAQPAAKQPASGKDGRAPFADYDASVPFEDFLKSHNLDAPAAAAASGVPVQGQRATAADAPAAATQQVGAWTRTDEGAALRQAQAEKAALAAVQAEQAARAAKARSAAKAQSTETAEATVEAAAAHAQSTEAAEATVEAAAVKAQPEADAQAAKEAPRSATCAHCNSPIVPPDALFCIACGTPVKKN